MSSYLAHAARIIESLDADAISGACDRLAQAALSGRQILIAGNGGSAAQATHLACDLSKSVLGRGYPVPSGGPRPRVVSLSDNTALLTAWANDVGYDCVFAEQVRSLGRAGDLLVVISASGNSPNVIRALEAAHELGLETLAFVGFGGGQAQALADLSVHVPADDYGIVEATLDVVSHLATRWIADRADLERREGALKVA